MLSEDPNFRQVHDRLSSESVFVYFDVASAEKEQQERRVQMEEEYKKMQEKAAANPPPPEVAENRPDDDEMPEFAPEELPPAELGPPQPAEDQFTPQPQLQVTGEAHQETPMAGPSGLDRLASSLFFGRPKWPEAVGVAITFDADTYIVRALLINGPEGKGNIIPFAPQLISGPPLAPEASSVLPATTELLVTLSLDLPLIYESTLNTLVPSKRDARGTRNKRSKLTRPSHPLPSMRKNSV